MENSSSRRLCIIQRVIGEKFDQSKYLIRNQPGFLVVQSTLFQSSQSQCERVYLRNSDDRVSARRDLHLKYRGTEPT